ncbi:MAG: type I-C CRISPR-associated protein Cas8c/Csd1 [Muribaculaceae bacterium]|nr:type I-C CRISPR-associated protein Cas8c/Csd1 [Muribaculaceae bacterium]
MILKSLYDYAQSQSDAIPPSGMERKEIEFVIVIDSEGKFKRFEHKRIDKKQCVSFLVAKGVKRTSAPKSNILWDNGKYVLSKNDKNGKCNALFIDIIKDIATKHPEDVSIQALLKFYTQPESDREEKMMADPIFSKVEDSLSANFSFRYEPDDMLIAEKKYLFDHLISESSEGTESGRCLVTGVRGPLVRTTTPTPLPDNSPMAALVAFQVNSGYDSYGKTQAYNSPISVESEETFSAVLKKFLGKDSRNKVRLGNRMILFWGSGANDIDNEVEEGLMSILEIPDKKAVNLDEKIEKVSKLFKSIFSGEIKTTLDDRFHILGLAPNTGRIAVVLWMDSELKDFAGKMLSHFDNMEIVDNRPPDKRSPYVGVYSMVSAVTQGGKISDALPNLVDETVKSVILGTPYPFPLYTGALNRIKAELSERSPTIQRVAILKAYINRKYNNQNQHKQLTVMLDKNNTNPGYLCGRLTAVLEKIQSDANTGDSIRTRYMGAASATPASVMPAMLNLSLHHSEKLSEGSRIHFEQLKQEIIDKLSADGCFPAHLDLNDQGRFFVGYYHQRTDLYTKKENKQ